MLEWVQQTKFERLGVFTYSHEENTGAFKLEDNVPAEIKQQRAEAVMNVQQKISLELNQKRSVKHLKYCSTGKKVIILWTH